MRADSYTLRKNKKNTLTLEEVIKALEMGHSFKSGARYFRMSENAFKNEIISNHPDLSGKYLQNGFNRKFKIKVSEI